MHQLEEGSSPTVTDTTESKGQHSVFLLVQVLSVRVLAGESPDTTPPAGSRFPTLNPDKLCKEEKEQLHQKLYTDSEELMYKFQEIFAAMRDSLKNRLITVSDISSHLDLLGPIKPTYQDSGVPPLRHQLPGLADAKTVDAAMSVVKDYCSFFNYRMLEHLINKLGTEQDKEMLAKCTRRTLLNMASVACLSAPRRLVK